MYSQENLGTLISSLICIFKLVFRAFQGVTFTFRHLDTNMLGFIPIIRFNMHERYIS